MMPAGPSSFAERVSYIWWLDGPVAAKEKSSWLSAVLADGAYLVAWPWLAALAPPLSFLIGLGLGAEHPGYIFSCSLVMVLGMFVIANFSAALGLWMWVGFLLGDFFHPHYIFRGNSFPAHLLYFYIPLVLTNLLLAGLLVITPLTAKMLRIRTAAELKLAFFRSRSSTFILHAVIQAMLAGVWTQTIANLVQPAFSWQGTGAPVECIRPLQHFGWILALTAGLMGAARIFAEYAATARPKVASRLREFGAAMAATRTRSIPRMPGWAALVLKAAFSTFMLSGLITRWWETLELMSMFLLLFSLRRLISQHWIWWARMVSRVPLLVRLLLATGVGAALSWRMVSRAYVVDNSFQSIILTVTICLLLVSFLIPGTGAQPKTQSQEAA
ncbi:MAG: hypothetical protein WBQ64_21195 [Terriglobales bacterium]